MSKLTGVHSVEFPGAPWSSDNDRSCEDWWCKMELPLVVPAVLPDVLLQSVDAIVPDDEPELEGTKPARQGNAPVLEFITEEAPFNLVLACI